MTNRSVGVPAPLWELIGRVALQAGPALGRRATFGDVISAALLTANAHHDEFAAHLGDLDLKKKIKELLDTSEENQP